MGVRMTVRYSQIRPNAKRTITTKIQYRVNNDGTVTKVASRKVTPNVTTG